MPAFQLTQAETARRDERYGWLQSLDEALGDANNVIQEAIEERDRIIGQFNDAADHANRFFAEVAGRMRDDDDDDYSDSASTLDMLEVGQAEETDLKIDDQPDYDGVFAEFDALIELEDETEPA